MQRKRNLMWRLVEGKDMPTWIMEGIVGEDAGLEDLIPEIKGPVRLDLFGVSRVNSTGVREWLRFVDVVDSKGPHRLARCSVPVVSQFNMIDNFKGAAVVESVMAPYYCDACGHEAATEVPIEQEKPVLPTQKCSECGEEMDFDELESRYFYFLSN